MFFDCCRAGIAELLSAGGSADMIEGAIAAYPLDDDEQDALRRWAIRRQPGSPVPGLGAGGCELLEDDEAS
jgi:hypothetical protein